MVVLLGLAHAGGIGAPRTASSCQAASLKLDFAVEEAQKLQVGLSGGICGPHKLGSNVITLFATLTALFTVHFAVNC